MPNAPTQVTVGTSAVQATNSITTMRNSILIKAASGNSGKVYWGITNGVLTTTGFEIAAGEAVEIPVAYTPDPSTIWLIGSASGQIVCVVVL